MIKDTSRNLLTSLFFFLSLFPAVAEAEPSNTAPTITPEIQKLLDSISADSLKGHLSFIASDLLEGRNTPSLGLEIAAEYIAAQFRRAGLEPAGNDGYFQNSPWSYAERSTDKFQLKIQPGSESIVVAPSQVSLRIERNLTVPTLALYKVNYSRTDSLGHLTVEQLAGKAVITEIPNLHTQDPSHRAEFNRLLKEFLKKMRELEVTLILSIDRSGGIGSGLGPGWLIDPENRKESEGPYLVTVHNPAIVKLYDTLSEGDTSASCSLNLPVPAEKLIRLRNVVGLLRGSDPILKDTCILITAHYDHIGMKPGGDGDRIYNGANDDGSGTVSVIELASALAGLIPRPRRSLLFMTVFGEEKGLLGSRYYGRHPIFPIEKTVAHLNLEVMGRTDSVEGPQPGKASLTGFDYSELGSIFKKAGELTGIQVYKDDRNSDEFFPRSDNQALADLGVPAHTLCASFMVPDYHGLDDRWEKIDYANMEKINRMAALGLIMIADNPVEPKWNEDNPKAAAYLKAWKERRRQSLLVTKEGNPLLPRFSIHHVE